MTIQALLLIVGIILLLVAAWLSRPSAPGVLGFIGLAACFAALGWAVLANVH